MDMSQTPKGNLIPKRCTPARRQRNTSQVTLEDPDGASPRHCTSCESHAFQHALQQDAWGNLTELGSREALPQEDSATPPFPEILLASCREYSYLSIVIPYAHSCIYFHISTSSESPSRELLYPDSLQAPYIQPP